MSDEAERVAQTPLPATRGAVAKAINKTRPAAAESKCRTAWTKRGLLIKLQPATEKSYILARNETNHAKWPLVIEFLASKTPYHFGAATLAFDYALGHQDATKEKLLKKRDELIREAEKNAKDKSAKGKHKEGSRASAQDPQPKAPKKPKRGSPKGSPKRGAAKKQGSPKGSPQRGAAKKGSSVKVADWFMGKANDDDEEETTEMKQDEEPESDEPEFGVDANEEKAWFDLLTGAF